MGSGSTGTTAAFFPVLQLRRTKSKRGTGEQARAAVSCSAYIRPSGNHFEIDNEDTGTALLWRKDATEGEEIEDYESCEKFVTKTALFTGVFVGVTWLCTELFCEWNDPPYGRSGFQCSSINPKPFAIVYYAENKKRLVPMDSIEKVER